jgi:hypothetical protein
MVTAGDIALAKIERTLAFSRLILGMHDAPVVCQARQKVIAFA